jgi:hypothetical protein
MPGSFDIKAYVTALEKAGHIVTVTHNAEKKQFTITVISAQTDELDQVLKAECYAGQGPTMQDAMRALLIDWEKA